MGSEHLDVLIVGAGLSGIGAGYYLQTRCPRRSYAILEGRAASGGTWDLFRYPGVRSDSDMHTLGYGFRPWRGKKAIADGAAILAYIRETAAAHGIERHIRYGHRVVRAAWDSQAARWTVTAERGAEQVVLTCDFLYFCSGYYRYERGYMPEWPGMAAYTGQMIHPQHWPEGLDYRGKRVVVIGSGATAVTLVPALAEQAAEVVMVQRSPSYVVAQPAEDRSAAWLRERLPGRLGQRLVRWKNALMGLAYYGLLRAAPRLAKRQLIKRVAAELGPDFDTQTHFTPRYNPWDQRLCLVPDGDLFVALRSGKARIVTDEIASFTPRGLRLRGGEELAAEIIVAATGLEMRLLDGVEVRVDGELIDLGSKLTYKGMMLSDVPNAALAIGYTNASWTLKCELTHRYVCRLLNHMERRGYAVCVARRRNPALGTEPALSFSSGYVQRALAGLPRQGVERPWKVYQNYLLDTIIMRLGRIEDGTLVFGRRGAMDQERGVR